MQYDDGFFRTLLDNLCEGVYFVNRDRNIFFWNRGAGEISGYRDFHVLGRPCDDGLLEHVDEQGQPLGRDRCPLAVTMEDGISREVRAYLHHREGHRVPVLVRSSAIRGVQGVITGAVAVFSDLTPQVQSEERIREMKLLALLDQTTGVGSRRWAETTIRNRVAERECCGLSSGLLLVEVDRFREICEKHGQEAGDEILRVTTRTLQGALQAEDVLGRWGDDSFLVVLATVEPRQLAATARLLHALVARSTVPNVPEVSLTVSIGASVTQAGDTAESLTRRVEELAVKAREGGGDRVEIDSGKEPDTEPRVTIPIVPRPEEEIERQRRIRTMPVHVPKEFRAAMRARARPS
ncbi:MAG: diguanylate cyclase domain-containing protein [Thermoanaerobaculia bacterium]